MAGAELSPSSGRIKKVRRLATRAFREETREFLVEGPQAVREALNQKDCVIEIFATDGSEWPDATIVDHEVINAIATTVTPQGVVARCKMIDVELDEALKSAKLVAVAHEVRDPGNAGTIIRAADAAGANAVIFTADSVDPFNPKAVRSSVGSIFHLPIVVEPDFIKVVESLRERGLQVVGTAANSANSVYSAQANLNAPTAWVFGNEAHGLPADLDLDNWLAIPIYGKAESLNLATAAALCLYASAQALNS